MDKEMIMLTGNHSDYDRLLQSVGETLEQGRQQAAYAVNSAMVRTYWEIGKEIVEYEQHGNEKAEYGSGLLNQLSKDLTIRYGSGFSLSNINKMRKMYLTYPILQTVSAKLTWSHYIELLKIDDPLERSFYEKECEEEHGNIIRYIKEKYGFNVSSYYIAQIKDKAGLEKRRNYHIGSGQGIALICPPEKEEAIMDAFRNFNMI